MFTCDKTNGLTLNNRLRFLLTLNNKTGYSLTLNNRLHLLVTKQTVVPFITGYI